MLQPSGKLATASTARAMQSARQTTISDQGERLGPHRPPPWAFGSSGLPPIRPVAGPDPLEPETILEPVAHFYPGPPPQVQEQFSWQSEVDFLTAATQVEAPQSLQQLHSASVPLASTLSSPEVEAMQQLLEQPATFTAGQLFSKASVWLDELKPSAYVQS